MIVLTDDHRYIDTETGREYPSVTQTIKDAGLMGYMPADDWYLHRGTAVHAATALFDRGELDESTVDPLNVDPYLQAWIKFRRDTCFEPTRIEEIVFDPVVGYCGTIDRDGLDIKTGGPCPWHVLQAAAYEHASPNGNAWKCVYLQDDGLYKIRPYGARELREAFKVFCSAVVINNWKRENKV